jgi:phosphoglucosamine mutase
MTRLFGTDGVRGLANKELTARLSLRLGESAARVLTRNSQGSRKRAIVGRDTRVSGEFISSSVCAGLSSAGVDVIDIGVLPTPGVAFLTAQLGVDLGVVISASHNAMPDNGIKFFANSGFKLEDSIEDEIEERLEEPWDRPTGADVGRITHDSGAAVASYIAHLVDVIGATENNKPLKGLEIVMDCANGAASQVAPEALRYCGANVTVIHASPDGYNINLKCGSTHPEQLQAIVKASGADLGVAFDGDADRLIAVDETGELIDGDKVITVLALDYLASGNLPQNKVVLTVMSNLGTRIALENAGVGIETTGVGDRYVLERMREQNLLLGGEQSGHIINLEHSTTGDGTLSALLLADVFARRRANDPRITISELAGVVHTLPQVLINVGGVDKTRMTTDQPLLDAIEQVEKDLGDTGRVLLRPSGTEPLVRVMIEAATQDVAQTKAQELADLVKERLAL